MAGATRLVITSDTLTTGLKEFPEKLDRAVSSTMDYFAPRIEATARSNAPWQDQTGNARNLLAARTEHVPGTRHAIILSHGVPYGIWLEVRFEGRYAIVTPTIQEQGPIVMALLSRLFARM